MASYPVNPRPSTMGKKALLIFNHPSGPFAQIPGITETESEIKL